MLCVKVLFVIVNAPAKTPWQRRDRRVAGEGAVGHADVRRIDRRWHQLETGVAISYR
jgi:hypothetical protein